MQTTHIVSFTIMSLKDFTKNDISFAKYQTNCVIPKGIMRKVYAILLCWNNSTDPYEK